MPKAVRRSIIALLLIIAASAVFGLTRLSTGPAQATSAIIESTTPGNGDQIQQQSPITIDLLSGWDAKLTIDGRAIPDEQLQKVKEQGIIKFQPGAGKALEYFPAGQNCVTLTYWQIANPDTTFTAPAWCFTAY